MLEQKRTLSLSFVHQPTSAGRTGIRFSRQLVRSILIRMSEWYVPLLFMPVGTLRRMHLLLSTSSTLAVLLWSARLVEDIACDVEQVFETEGDEVFLWQR